MTHMASSGVSPIWDDLSRNEQLRGWGVCFFTVVTACKAYQHSEHNLFTQINYVGVGGPELDFQQGWELVMLPWRSHLACVTLVYKMGTPACATPSLGENQMR